MNIAPEHRKHVQGLLDFIDASPSPWHVTQNIAESLLAEGWTQLQEKDKWNLQVKGRYFIIRGGSSIIALQIGEEKLQESGYRIVGAHTDSPGLRLKAKAPHVADGMLRLGVEIYGGPILATFTDRDLSIAGRVFLRGDTIKTSLVRFEEPLLRLPNLAIHLNRTVNESGLKLQSQTELPLLLCGSEVNREAPNQRFEQLLADQLGSTIADLMSFELNVYDTQKSAFWGPDGEFIAASRLDNLSSCYAGLTALTNRTESRYTAVAAFFDHEEIGSQSHKGADSSFLTDVLERIASSMGLDATDYRRAMAGSFMVSADAAHAHHPNFPGAYEPLHGVRVNQGPVIKLNANQRYATDGLTEACFMQMCESTDVPFQKYVHRSDMACGSTIGPITSARLGIPTVDCGCPLWAMHSIRESAGVMDQVWLARVIRELFETRLNHWSTPA